MASVGGALHPGNGFGDAGGDPERFHVGEADAELRLDVTPAREAGQDGKGRAVLALGVQPLGSREA